MITGATLCVADLTSDFSLFTETHTDTEINQYSNTISNRPKVTVIDSYIVSRYSLSVSQTDIRIVTKYTLTPFL